MFVTSIRVQGKAEYYMSCTNDEGRRYFFLRYISMFSFLFGFDAYFFYFQRFLAVTDLTPALIHLISLRQIRHVIVKI